jgi:two-component system phosphate regulon sensor histidine kinase PhoR
MRLKEVSETNRLRELEEMKRQFISTVSHELLTPIAAIKASVETLLHRVSDEKDRAQFIEIIDKHSSRLGFLVEDWLAMPEFESRKAPTKSSSVALHSFAHNFIKGIKPLAKRKEVSIQVDIGESLDVWVDQAHLARIFKDLIDNAIKYNKKGGSIRLEAKKINKRQAQISIRDTGIGIPGKDLSLIFREFHRTEKARERAIRGAGLGLSIIKTIVEFNGGRIWAESVKGRGSVFHVVLPLLPESSFLKKIARKP